MACDAGRLPMCEGGAEDAGLMYAWLFGNSTIGRIETYAAGVCGARGPIKLARFSLRGQSFACSDYPVKHAFGLRPQVSIMIELDDTGAHERIFQRLADGGAIPIPFDDERFSRGLRWLDDRLDASRPLNPID